MPSKLYNIRETYRWALNNREDKLKAISQPRLVHYLQNKEGVNYAVESFTYFINWHQFLILKLQKKNSGLIGHLPYKMEGY